MITFLYLNLKSEKTNDKPSRNHGSTFGPVGFCFCKFFYLSLKEDILAVGPCNCRIHLTLIDFSLFSILKWRLPACLLERSFPLESRNMV